MNINRSDGWIKVHKKVIYSSLWQDMNSYMLFHMLLLMAHHENDFASVRFAGKQVYLKAGQLSASREELAKFLEWPSSRVRNALYRLRDDSRVVLQSDNHITIITICNWSNYQVRDGQPRDNKSTTARQPEDNPPLSNRRKEEKNKESNNPISNAPKNESEKSLVATAKAVTTTKITDKDKQLAKLLHTLLYANYAYLRPKATPKLAKALGDTSDAINKLHRIDGYDYGTIEAVIRWCQQDAFWKKNIQSGVTLRKQFAAKLLVNIQTDVEKKHKSRKLEDDDPEVKAIMERMQNGE